MSRRWAVCVVCGQGFSARTRTQDLCSLRCLCRRLMLQAAGRCSRVMVGKLGSMGWLGPRSHIVMLTITRTVGRWHTRTLVRHQGNLSWRIRSSPWHEA
jgi:hypothetical protein